MSYNTIIQKIFLSSKNSVSFVAIGKDIDTGERTESTRHFIDTTKDYAEQLQLDSRFMKEINIIYEENNISEEIVKNLSNAITDADNKKFALTESGKSTWESLSQLVFINYGQTTCESVEYLLEYVGKSKMISNFGIHTCSSVKYRNG